MVRLDDVTRPPAAATPEPEPEPTREATPQPPPRPPQPVPEPPAPPEPQQVAKAEPAPPPPPEAVPLPPKEKAPDPKPEPPPPVEAKPEPPPPAPEPEPAPAPQPATAKVQPKAKPKPPEPTRDFASVLKDLAAEDTPRQTAERSRKPESAKTKGEEAPEQSQVAELASIQEIDRLGVLIRQQISPCWSPPPGARDAETLIVSLQIAVDQQGNVSRVDYVDPGRMAVDVYFRSAAEAAARAVRRCSPLNLPQDKYEIWKNIRFNFDPSKMLS
ncbi:MAG: cell envelope integrity protein TolA [Alphaproteobacteria bacterium]|nr:cell envelope integrity protein TolA [Alphaproteobacteria bacterium]